MVTKRLSDTWEVERESEAPDYHRYEVFTVRIEAVYDYAPAHGEDPGERRLEFDKVTFQGDPFALTSEEEQQIRVAWLEELS